MCNLPDFLGAARCRKQSTAAMLNSGLLDIFSSQSWHSALSASTSKSVLMCESFREHPAILSTLSLLHPKLRFAIKQNEPKTCFKLLKVNRQSCSRSIRAYTAYLPGVHDSVLPGRTSSNMSSSMTACAAQSSTMFMRSPVEGHWRRAAHKQD